MTDMDIATLQHNFRTVLAELRVCQADAALAKEAFAEATIGLNDTVDELRALCAALYQIIGTEWDASGDDPRWLPVMDLLGKAGNNEPLGCDPIETLLPWNSVSAALPAQAPVPVDSTSAAAACTPGTAAEDR